MKVHLKRVWKKFLVAGAAVALVTGMASTLPSAYAGGTIKAADDQWISVGMGIRTSFNAQENGAANGKAFSNEFAVNNARIYINGQIHKYVKFTFNTECFNCSVGGGAGTYGNSNIGLLDAIGKFEYNELLNLWVGRTLVPTDRGELNGPFYHPTFEGFKTPLFPNDNSGNVGGGASPGGGAFGRDDGAVYYGKAHPFNTHLLWVGSVFKGYRGNCNCKNSLMYAGRLQWNLLNDEMAGNPGYYTSGTYYGTVGDILALAVGISHQKDGSGGPQFHSDFTGLVFDALFEKLLPGNAGVFTANAEFKRFWAERDPRAYTVDAAVNGFTADIFSGRSWTAYALYLFPNKIGWGQFQPYFRYTDVTPNNGSSRRNEWEFGTNYVIVGHNARISAFWQYGDLATKGTLGGPGSTGFGIYDPLAQGQKVHAYKVALQLQY